MDIDYRLRLPGFDCMPYAHGTEYLSSAVGESHRSLIEAGLRFGVGMYGFHNQDIETRRPQCHGETGANQSTSDNHYIEFPVWSALTLC